MKRYTLLIYNGYALYYKKFKISGRIEDFSAQAMHRVKIKENKKSDKYFDLARELRKQEKMKVTVRLEQTRKIWKGD